MSFARILADNRVILSECAVSERLRRLDHIDIHPTLFNTLLIYEANGRQELEKIYLSYVEVATAAALPLLLCAPTWRVDKGRVEEAGVPKSINRDAVSFMLDIKKHHSTPDSPITTGALLAPKNDCYSPAAALSRRRSAEFHGWQIDELADSGAEVIVAQTMPALSEALGMADRLSVCGRPYLISFVIDRLGRVLDNTPLAEAVDAIDQAVADPPAGYMVNCVYPTFIRAETQTPAFFKRLVGIQANASSLDHAQLDGSEQLQQDPLPDWTRNMVKLNREFGVRILGGCCGTDHIYLKSLADALRQATAA